MSINTLFWRFLKVSCLTLICSFSAYAQNINLILAADMPDISDSNVGRYAELKNLLDEYREQPEPLFFVFGGGSVGPSAMSVFDRGAHIIDILNSLEPDVMTVTKREFSYLEDELSLRAYEAAFPIVATNVIDSRFNVTPDGLLKYALVEKQGVKMGVISILNERIVDEYLLKQITVQDPKQTTQSVSSDLRNKGADLILLHYSYPFEFINDLLTDEVVDVGFMSDTRLLEKNQSVHEHKNNITLDKTGVVVVSKLDIDKGTVNVVESQIKSLASLAADSSVQLQIDSYQLRLNRLLEQRIGFWQSEFTTKRPDVRGGENTFANFVVDAMREYAESDIAIFNGGSIRGDTTYKSETPITRRIIATELPFRSSLTKIQVTGKQIQLALESGLSQFENLKGGFPHVSGMVVKFDSSKPVGERILSIEVDGSPIQQGRLYTLATTNYLANGGDGYASFVGTQSADPNNTIAILISDLVIQEALVRGGINSRLEGRLQDMAGQQ